MERCGNCRFWDSGFDVNEDIGECHRYPPQLVSMTPSQMSSNQEGSDSFDVYWASRWPAVDSAEWCGEYQSMENAGS